MPDLKTDRRKGWAGAPKLQLDGKNWTIEFAADILDFPERDLRDLVRILKITPAGTLNMREYPGQGRIPRAYPATMLINVCEAAYEMAKKFNSLQSRNLDLGLYQILLTSADSYARVKFSGQPSHV